MTALKTGDIVSASGSVQSYHEYIEDPLTGLELPPKSKHLESMDFDSPKKCLVLGWTMRYEGNIQRWNDEEQPWLYVTKKIKVWVLMPISHNRYCKTFLATESQITNAARDDAEL